MQSAASLATGIADLATPGEAPMLRRFTAALAFAFALGCGGSQTNPPPPPPGKPIDPQTAQALAGSLNQAAGVVAGSSLPEALAARGAALALALGARSDDVMITASLLAGSIDRAALTTGAASAFGFQIQIENLAGSTGTETFTGVFVFESATDWILVAGPAPGSPIPPGLGLLGSGGQLWKGTAGQESAQLQSEGATCTASLPSGVTSCKIASFVNAGFGITASSPASSGATGSKTASLAAGSLSAGVSLVVDCSVGTLCPAKGTTQVYVAPTTFNLGLGGSQRFAATVVGNGITNESVSWSVDEAGGGAITSAGIYTAPTTTGTYHVRATSVADSTASAVATVTVTHPSGIAVSVSPGTPSLTVNSMLFFEAAVTGSPDTAVTWSLDEAGGGSVSTSGQYTAPGTPGTFHVRATSLADPTVSAAATVTVSFVSVTVSAQPQQTDGQAFLDCVPTTATVGQVTYAWHGYRDDGDTSGLSFSSLTSFAPTLTLTTTASVGASFYVYCVISEGGAFAGSGYTLVTLGTGGLLPAVTVSPSTIHAGASSVTFDGTSTANAQSPAIQWVVQYGGNVSPASLEDYLTIPAASWTTVYTDNAPSGLTETVPAAKFGSAGAYRVQLTVLSALDEISENEGTFYFQVLP